MFFNDDYSSNFPLILFYLLEAFLAQQASIESQIPLTHVVESITAILPPTFPDESIGLKAEIEKEREKKTHFTHNRVIHRKNHNKVQG